MAETTGSSTVGSATAINIDVKKRPVGSLPPSKPPTGPAPPRRSVCAPAAMLGRLYRRPHPEGYYHVVQKNLQVADLVLISPEGSSPGLPGGTAVCRSSRGPLVAELLDRRPRHTRRRQQPCQ